MVAGKTGQYVQYNFNVVGEDEVPIASGLSVTVYAPAGTSAATVYADENETALTNPILSAAVANNEFKFWYARATCDLKIGDGNTQIRVNGVSPLTHRIVFPTALSGLKIMQGGDATTLPLFSNFPFYTTDPFYFHKFEEDFIDLDLTRWVITTVEAGSGAATEVLTDAAGGALLITNDDADNDEDEFQTAYEVFKLAAGKALWAVMKATLSEATQSDFFFGLSIRDTSILASLPSDCVLFRKDDGDTNIDTVVCKGTTATTGSAKGTMTTASHVYGIYFDGVTTVKFYYDGALIDTVITNIPDDQELALSFVVANGSANARTLTVDYVGCWQVR
jgi:hypothetical protein